MKIVTDLSQQKIKDIPLQEIEINDPFWNQYRSLLKSTVIPYQYDALNDRIPDAEPSYSVYNFRVAAGELEGPHKGAIFQDSDVAKWLEAVGYLLAYDRDEELEKKADDLIDLIARAQQPDGYLNTYYIIEEPDKRWTNLYDCHELYCAGHMIEAAVSYYKATGKRKLLEVVCRYADLIDEVFGTEEGKLKGYPGHPEIELALVKLYQATDNEKYLNLSKYFVDQRGQKPNYFNEEWEKRGRTLDKSSVFKQPNLYYGQSFAPVREQEVATGHSVRAVYLYTAMADLARLTKDDELKAACQRLWNNITHKQMYITGGIGSTEIGEAFTFDYDLPNDTMYCETCASVGLTFMAKRMLALDINSKYADIIEKELFNIIIESMALDGKHYFYVNPLEVWPEASEKDPRRKHVKETRQKWFGVSCCPPNVARLLGSLGDYIYTVTDKAVYTHLYIGSNTHVNIDGAEVTIKQSSKLPWKGEASFKLDMDQSAAFTFGFRIPAWVSGKFKVLVNGQEVSYEVENGYALIDRQWGDGDTVEIEIPMSVQLMRANSKVHVDAGKVAIQRGPLVYCVEEQDNGKNLSLLLIEPKTEWIEKEEHFQSLGKIISIEASGYRDINENEQLYFTFENSREEIKLKAIPYFVWGNRGIGEMRIWLRY
jgi:uncharacterized protein